MATTTSKGKCIRCGKEKSAVRCEGCLQLFCFNHLSGHRQELSTQLEEIEINRDIFRQTLTEQIDNSKEHPLIKQIDQWEEQAISKVRQTAKECREEIVLHTVKSIKKIEVDLVKITDQLREAREESEFNEIDISEWKQKLTQLTEELNRPSNISIQPNSGSLINKVSIVTSSRQLVSSAHININRRWKRNGITIAGGNGPGDKTNQLHNPDGIYVNEDRSIYIADYENHRIIEFKNNAKNGQIVAGGNGLGNRLDQLDNPMNVIVDQRNGSLLICDSGNKRIVRWPRQNGEKGQIILSNVDCYGLTMDNNGDLYFSDYKKNEVRRWKLGETNGTIVAGGKGQGTRLDQLHYPSYIFVDEDYSVYISDQGNHRIMKWTKGAKEGIVFAGGQGEGESLTQLSSPYGLVVDNSKNIYVADSYNHRVVCWPPDSRQGHVLVGGNGEGQNSDQFKYPTGLAFDRYNNLYVVDYANHRVQRFDVD